MKHPTTSIVMRLGSALLLAAAVAQVSMSAQDRLKTMPGYAQYQRMTRVR